MEYSTSPRFSLVATDLEEVVDKHAPQEPSRTLLRQLILNILHALHRRHRFDYEMTSLGRQQRLADLRALEQSFSKLVSALEVTGPLLQSQVRLLLADEVGASLSDHSFNCVRRPRSDLSLRTVARPEGLRAQQLYEALEDEAARYRRSTAEDAAEIVLAAFARRCAARILNYLERERLHRGGNPGRIYRNHVLIRLAASFHHVFATTPTTTVDGPFELLAADVLPLFDLDTDGLDQAIKRCLRHLKAQ
jgi:hypothetical protein